MDEQQEQSAPLDTSMYYGRLKKPRVVQCNEKAFVAHAAKHWAASFAINRLQGKGSGEFTRNAESDGVSVSVYFQQIKLVRDDVLVVSVAS
eukprot:jgi/Pico_ML_1/51724/g290.t1